MCIYIYVYTYIFFLKSQKTIVKRMPRCGPTCTSPHNCLCFASVPALDSTFFSGKAAATAEPVAYEFVLWFENRLGPWDFHKFRPVWVDTARDAEAPSLWRLQIALSAVGVEQPVTGLPKSEPTPLSRKF